MNISLIGNSGFVGKNIIEQKVFEFTKYYNSSNIEDLTKTTHKIIVCAAPSAEKWRANLYPDEDLLSMNTLINNLKHVSNKTKFFLISTVDVYGINNFDKTENSVPEPENFYGKHRLLLETFIKQKFQKYHIIRLPGLFGKFLKKNIIFDLLNNNLKDNKVNIFDEYQWFDLSDIKHIFSFVEKENLNILNVCSEPIPNHEILKFFTTDNLHLIEKKFVSYNIKTIHNKDNYLYNKNLIIDKIGTFINENRNI